MTEDVHANEFRLIRQDIAALREDVAAINVMLKTEAARCPYREDIARARNNVKRITRLEEHIASVRVDIAKAGIGGGIAGAAATIGAGLAIAGKILGWW